MTPETLFYVGSITKSVLAASLLHVLESTSESDKPITLDTQIHDVIPEDFVLSDDYATLHATIKDALTHRLGYPRHDLSYGGAGFTAKDAVRSLRKLSMSAELREKFQYYNMGYQTLQHVIETLTGKWCGDVYDEAVFKPLRMDSSTARFKTARDEIPYTLASGFGYDVRTETLNPQPWWDTPIIGEGGVITNARDMAKYLRAMMSHDGGLPLSEESHKALTTPLIIGSTAPKQHHTTSLYAAGWVATSYRGHRFIYHGGGVPGFAATAGFLPDLNWGAVVMTNGDLMGMAAVEIVFYRLMDDFLGAPEEDKIDLGKTWEGILTMKKDNYVEARKKNFPDVPSPAQPHSLPLEEYAGVYSHPGYRTLTFSVAKPESDLPVSKSTAKVLHALKTQSSWDVVFDLEHVSGEHFICYINTLARSPMLQEASKAEFDIGGDGKVTRLGIQIESGLKEKIWFEKT